jgi:GTP-binding protein
LETDVALKVEDGPNGDWVVSGRGELHLGVLIERMRREGYEFQVSQPQAVLKIVDGKKMTPYEKVFIEVPEIYSGTVIQRLNERLGELKNMQVIDGIASLEFSIPTKGLLGYRSTFLTDTKGLGIMSTMFDEFRIDSGREITREHGSLVAHETGLTNLYGLTAAQDRGVLFVLPGVPVYKGQIVGENSRAEDISVNVCKTKALSNMRSKGEGGMIHFNAPRQISLDYALEYIGPSDLVEVTPKSIRLRKIILDVKDEKRAKKGL